MSHSRFAGVTRAGCCLVLSLLSLCAATSLRAVEVINTASVSFDGIEGPVTLPTNHVRTVREESAGGVNMFVRKTASRETAEIGDFVDFTIVVKNVANFPLSPIEMEDQLPFGFTYETGSALLDGKKMPDPKGGSGPYLTFALGSLDSGMAATITYRTRIGVAAKKGDGINRASAHTTISPISTSNVASVMVRVRGGVFTTRGIIFGKVFVDTNGNRIQDGDEPGIPGVRLYIEDGSYIITDEEGKYSFYGLTARTHIVKLDRTTLPPGAHLEPLNTRNAGNGGSVFAEMKFGEMRKVNFAIDRPTPEIMDYVDHMRAAATGLAHGSETDASLKATLNKTANQEQAADRRSLPSTGLISPGVAVQPTSQDRSQGSEAFMLGGIRPGNPAAQAGTGLNGFATVGPTHATEPAPVTPYGETLPRTTAPSSPLSLEQTLTSNPLAGTFGFLDLKDHDTLPMAQANIRVVGVAGAGKLVLNVNGHEVSERRIGKRATMTGGGAEALEYVGVELQPGENHLDLAQFDQFGNAHHKTITVIAPDRLGHIRIKTADDAIADGRTPTRVVVELVDKDGVPVTARTSLTLEATLGKWLVEDLNPREPGTQVFIQGGHAEFELAPPIEPGECRLRVSSGSLEGDAVVSFLPELRPMLAAGVIEGAINVHHLDANALRPVNSRDTFDKELHEFAIYGNDANAAGRGALFLKGKVLGSYLLTASYDSEKQTRSRLFRDIQPDEFYPVYGDSSVKGFEAQSTGPLYVRIDNKHCYLLYGDFVTQGPNEVRQLSNYNRSLNGAREHYENKHITANGWAAYDDSKQVVEELPANGTSGPYGFHSASGLVNSEKVEIITRDRNNSGLIIKIVNMTRFSDYEFEPLTGQLLFKAPIPSLDPDLNPISIRMTYEITQGGEKFWVYGADAQVKVTDRIQVGGAFAREEDPRNHYGLYGGNAVFDLGAKTFLFGEFAHSSDELLGDGNAERIELRHNSDKLFARIYWGQADDQFHNQNSILAEGRTEGGAQISYQFGKKTRALIQALDSESRAGGTLRGVLAGVEQTFGKDIRLELDGRYSTESETPANLTSAETKGATPNEVRSARMKLTIPLPWLDGSGHIYGEYEQDLVDEEKRLAAIGGDYQLDTKTRFYFRHEFISSLGGPFQLNSVQRQNNTVVGIESTYAKDATLFNEYRQRDAITGREAEAAIGLRNAWNLGDGLRLQTTFERVAPEAGATTHASDEATAVTGALEYTADPDWKAATRLELRTSETVDSLLNTIGFGYKMNAEWTALAKSIVYIANNKGPDQVDQRQARIQLGAAWRQTSTDIWNALGKYEFRTENGAAGLFDPGISLSTHPVNRDVNIISLDVNCQPAQDWQISGHYAGKLVFDDSDKHDDWSHAHLLIGRVVKDINDRIDVGLNVSGLFDGNGGVQYGVGPEVGVTLAENLRLGIGYNFSGFNDCDLSQEEYTQHGFYIALRLKFDEAIFHRRKEE